MIRQAIFCLRLVKKETRRASLGILVLVADRSNHRIQIFDENRVFVHAFGSEGQSDGRFNGPHGVDG